MTRREILTTKCGVCFGNKRVCPHCNGSGMVMLDESDSKELPWLKDKLKNTSVIDHKMDEVLKLLDITMTQDEYIACKYLESRGLKFAIDFGYVNAQDMMIDFLISDELFALKESTIN